MHPTTNWYLQQIKKSGIQPRAKLQELILCLECDYKNGDWLKKWIWFLSLYEQLRCDDMLLTTNCLCYQKYNNRLSLISYQHKVAEQ